MDIPKCISRCVEETQIFNDQKKLDALYYLMQGLSYKDVAEKIDKEITYVQRIMNFLKRSGLLHWGRWTPNVYRIGMKKSIAFLNWEEREVPVKDNFKYTTYAHHVQAEETKVFTIYTYPKEDKSKIEGDKGELITPFYYTHTRFTIPFFKKIDLFEEFFDEFDSVDNDEKILTGTPSFETDPSYTDPITVYICRYCELLPELTAGILQEYLMQDFKDYEDVNTSYENIQDKLKRAKDEGVIFPRNALHLVPLFYQSALVRIETDEIYKIMGTFNQFNMLTRLALTESPRVFYLYIQYPFYQLPDVMEILNERDSHNKAYIETKYVMNDTIYYKWSLERYLE